MFQSVFCQASLGSDLQNGGIMAALVGMFLGMIELTKYIINRTYPSATEKEIKELSNEVVTATNAIQRVSQEVHELYVWHNVDWPQQPGVKIWWVSSLGKPIEEFASNQQRVVEVLTKVKDNQDKIIAHLNNEAGGRSGVLGR